MQKIPILLPRLGEAVAEATVQTWLCQSGDTVAKDQDLLEVETEKSIIAIPAPAAGVLLDIDKPAGSRCQVNEVLAWLHSNESDVVQPVDSGSPHAAPTPTETSPTHTPTASLASNSGRHGFLSPRLRALMQEQGLTELDLHLLRGSGQHGRIKADDLTQLLEHLQSHYEPHPAGMLRQAVADSMSRSWNRPLATVSSAVKMDALLAHRKTLPERPSASVYALSTLAQALKEDGRIAKLLLGDQLWQAQQIDLALAIDVDNGIYNPVIQSVDAYSLGELAVEVKRLIAQAHERQLPSNGHNTGIATVSNYGSLGITWATPLPPPGHSCLLGLGAVRRQPDWHPATQSWQCIRACEITLTFDHRIADGGTAARLIHRIVHLLEHPDLLS